MILQRNPPVCFTAGPGVSSWLISSLHCMGSPTATPIHAGGAGVHVLGALMDPGGLNPCTAQGSALQVTLNEPEG